MFKYFVAALCFVSCLANAEQFKVGHQGFPAQDVAVRKLLLEENVVVRPFPGGRGIIAFNALDRGEIEFLVVSASTAFTSQINHPEVFDYDPLQKFRPVTVLTTITPVFMLPARYSSMDELGTQKCRERDEPVMVGAVNNTGEIALPTVREALKRYRCSFVEVPYKDQTGAMIDASMGRIDVMVTAPIAGASFADRATLISFGSIKSELVQNAQFGMIVLTKRDLPQERIDAFMGVLQSNSVRPESVKFVQQAKMQVDLSTGKLLENKLRKMQRSYVSAATAFKAP